MGDRHWNNNWHEGANASAAQMFNCLAVRCSAFCAATTAVFGVAAGVTGHAGTAALFAGSLLVQAGLGYFNLRHRRYYADPMHRSPPGRNEYRCREALMRIGAAPVLAMATFGAACFVYEPKDLSRIVITDAVSNTPATVKPAQPQ